MPSEGGTTPVNLAPTVEGVSQHLTGATAQQPTARVAAEARSPQPTLDRTAASETVAAQANITPTGEICSFKVSLTPNTTVSHSFNFRVQDRQGQPLPNLVVDLWADDQRFPDLQRGKLTCSTDQNGTCTIQASTAATIPPQIFVGATEPRCASSILPLLPADGQDIVITMTVAR